VSRSSWLKPLALLAALVAAATMAWWLFISRPAARRLASLPAALDAQRQAVIDLAEAPAAEAQAEQLAEHGRQRLARNDASGAESALERLRELQTRLEQQYELRIVSRPGERSGVIRTPDVNQAAQNFYIIVEPVAPDGQVLTLPVVNEEDGVSRSVNRWGLRVEKETFDRIAADKSDDGIIQNNRFGAKRLGHLAPEYFFSSTGAAITSW
jgi:hypothetical protein